MATNDIFDDIITCLKLEEEKNSRAFVNENVLRDFFTPVANSQQTQPQNIRQTTPAAKNNKTQLSPQSSAPFRQKANSPQKKVAPTPAADISKMPLRELWQTAMRCQNCTLCNTRNNVVFGDGNQNADLMFIGEGPGHEEDVQGRPFVGRAGQLLDKMITAMQFTREEVYIANVIKCRPPENRNPLPDEANACMPYLLRQIELVKPKVIVLLGAVPLQYLFNKRGVTRMHGTWLNYNGIDCMVTFHPAYLLRYPEGKREAWSDLQKVMHKFGKKPQ